MTQKVLITGANGRFGQAATHAFHAAGWQVHAATRSGTAPHVGGVVSHAVDVTDPVGLARASTGMDVILHGANPPYTGWKDALPKFTDALIAAARSSGATLLIPGNVYSYGRTMPPVLTSDTPHRPESRKGKLRRDMDAALRASGVQTIILRAGDFLEPRASKVWFDIAVARDLGAGRMTWPGPPDLAHAWAWLPDMARAAEGLAATRDTLPAYIDVPFAGMSASGSQMREGLERALGHGLKIRRFPWLALRLGAPLVPMWREILEMKYLWDVPHSLDGGLLAELLPQFTPTPEAEIYRRLAEVFAPGISTSTQTSLWADAASASAARVSSGAGQKTPDPVT